MMRKRWSHLSCSRHLLPLSFENSFENSSSTPPFPPKAPGRRRAPDYLPLLARAFTANHKRHPLLILINESAAMQPWRGHHQASRASPRNRYPVWMETITGLLYQEDGPTSLEHPLISPEAVHVDTRPKSATKGRRRHRRGGVPHLGLCFL